MALEACDFRTLENLCPGRVGAPGSPLYEAGRRVFSRAGRIRSPAAVLRPADRNQVAAIMAWANAAGIRLSIRSGGHSFDGFPVRDDGVLLDLRGLSAVRYAPSGYLHAMTGATVGDIARALDGTGRAMPIGECPTVGVGGLVLGGGFGQCTRHFGRTSDFLAEATVVTANGQIHVTNTNLFWGLRGGAGCVGIVTDLVFHTVPIQQVTGVTLGWRWDAAVEAILLFTQLMHTAPSELDLQLSIRTTGADRYADEASAGPADVIPGTPRVRIDGQFLGNQDDARSLMRPLLEHPAALHASIRDRIVFRCRVRLERFSSRPGTRDPPSTPNSQRHRPRCTRCSRSGRHRRTDQRTSIRARTAWRRSEHRGDQRCSCRIHAAGNRLFPPRAGLCVSLGAG